MRGRGQPSCGGILARLGVTPPPMSSPPESCGSRQPLTPSTTRLLLLKLEPVLLQVFPSRLFESQTSGATSPTRTGLWVVENSPDVISKLL